MVREPLDFAIERTHVLAVNLEGAGPEVALPDESGLSVSQPHVVLVIDVARGHELVETSDVVPETDDDDTGCDGPDLEPSLRVD